MKILSDEMLLESYYKSLDLQLELEFIQLLQIEIKRRDLIAS